MSILGRPGMVYKDLHLPVPVNEDFLFLWLLLDGLERMFARLPATAEKDIMPRIYLRSPVTHLLIRESGRL
jgi:hypothetical protein